MCPSLGIQGTEGRGGSRWESPRVCLLPSEAPGSQRLQGSELLLRARTQGVQGESQPARGKGVWGSAQLRVGWERREGERSKVSLSLSSPPSLRL